MTHKKEIIRAFFSIQERQEDLQFNSELIGKEMTLRIIEKRLESANFEILNIGKKKTGNKLFDWGSSIELIFNAFGFVLDAFNIFDWIKSKSKDKKVSVDEFRDEIFKIQTNSTLDREIVFNYILETRKEDIKN